MNPVGETTVIYEEQIRRIVESDTFQGSPASRKLLTYLGQRTLAGDAEDLKEYTIGVEALDRPLHYDPQVDPSVRVQVSRLRKRLATYFEVEGSGDPFRVDLPKRQFGLRFAEKGSSTGEWAIPSVISRPAVPAVSSAGGRQAAVPGGWRIAALLLGVVVILLVTLQVRRPVNAEGSSAIAGVAHFTPAMRDFWSPYFESNLPTTLSLGVAMFIRVPSEDALSTTYVRQSGVNDWPPADEVPGLSLLSQRLGPADAPHPIYNYCGVGEAIGSYLLGKSLNLGGLDTPIVRSSFLSWDEANSSNVIFVGPPKFNRQIEGGSYEKNFRVVQEGIKNLHPAVGEPSFYGKQDRDGRPTVAHAVISRFPNGSGSGVVTIFASNDGTGTWAGVEQITRPDLADSLVRKIRRADGSIPASFEIVVRARCDQDYPVEISYVTHRAY